MTYNENSEQLRELINQGETILKDYNQHENINIFANKWADDCQQFLEHKYYSVKLVEQFDDIVKSNTKLTTCHLKKLIGMLKSIAEIGESQDNNFDFQVGGSTFYK